MRPPRSFSPDPSGAHGQIFNALTQEIEEERISALGEAGRKAEKALAALAEFEAADNHEDDEAKTQARERLLDQAGKAVWGLMVQRELMGLRNQRDLVRLYQIPRAVMNRVGIVGKR